MTTSYKVTGVNIEGSSIPQKMLTEEEADYKVIAKKAMELVQQLITDGILPPEAVQQLQEGTLTMQVQGNRFTLLDSTGKEILTRNTEDNPKLIQVIKPISDIAKTHLSPSPTSPSITTKPSPHSMENGKFYCYANSAYQLLGNIPSLRRSVLENLPDSLKALKDYSKMNQGSALISTWNKATNAKEKFSITRGQMASEFLERLIGKCESYPFSDLTTVHIRKNPQINPKKGSSSEPQGFLGLNTTQQGESIDFARALATALKTQVNPNDVDDEEAIESHSFFATNPTQLFIKVDRFKEGKKEERPVKNIPIVLDTNLLIKDGVAPTKLELKGFIVHTGSGLGHAGGHYTAYVRVEDSENPGSYHWIHADDAKDPRVVNEQELKQALENASDLYYDNELLEPKIQVNKLTTTLQYIDNKETFLATESENESITYTGFLQWAFENFLSQEEQETIACNIAQQYQGFLSKTLQIPLIYGQNYIQKNPEDPYFKQLLKEALTKKRDSLLQA